MDPPSEQRLEEKIDLMLLKTPSEFPQIGLYYLRNKIQHPHICLGKPFFFFFFKLTHAVAGEVTTNANMQRHPRHTQGV